MVIVMVYLVKNYAGSEMNKVLIIVLSLVSANVFAEWTKIFEYQTSTFYVDLGSIHKHDDLMQILSLNSDSNGKSSDYTSIATITEYDCHNKTSQIKNLKHYKETMAVGQSISDSNESTYPLLSIIPNAKTIDNLEFEMVCGNNRNN